MVVFGKRWLHSGKNGCTWPKIAVFGHCGFIPVENVVIGQKQMYSGKVVVLGQRWLYYG